METYEIWEGYGEQEKKGVVTLNGDIVELNIPDEHWREFFGVIGLGDKGYTPMDGKEYINALCLAFRMSSTIFISKVGKVKKYINPILPNESDLYSNRLLPDIKTGKVFPALRLKGIVDFYYKGGNLFKYNKTFSTHVKYAAVLTGHDMDYIDEETIKSEGCRLNNDFGSAYERIKENCKLFQKDEASGVAKIYHNSSYAMEKRDDIVVLDIEKSYASLNDSVENAGAKQYQDRIDLLLYNTKEQRLRFYEAKHFTNKELWSKDGTKPDVVKQINRYNKQLKERKNEILEAYVNYVTIVNNIFNSNLPEPTDLDIEVVLLVFGFDNSQKEKIKKLLIDDNSLSGLRYRFIGNPKSASDLWKNVQEPK
jgi:hypothetical protein